MNNLSKMDDIKEKVSNMLIEVGKMQLKKFNSREFSVFLNKDGEYFIDIDKESEREIINKLSSFWSGFILSEESGLIKIGNSENQLAILDPLDGTNNYIHSIPCWAISLALIKNNLPFLSAIYFPYLDKLFIVHEERIYENGIEMNFIELSSNSKIASVSSNLNTDKLKGIRKRAFGCPSYSFIMVAKGALRWFASKDSSNLWDILPGSMFVRASGGEIYDFCGNLLADLIPKIRENYKGKISFFAVNKKISYEEALSELGDI